MAGPGCTTHYPDDCLYECANMVILMVFVPDKDDTWTLADCEEESHTAYLQIHKARSCPLQ